MTERHIGFEIRTLSNLIHRKINQMVTEEEEALTPGLGAQLSDPSGRGSGYYPA